METKNFTVKISTKAITNVQTAAKNDKRSLNNYVDILFTGLPTKQKVKRKKKDL